MSNIIKARVKIKGTRPLFWHHFGPEALPLHPGEKTGVPGHDPEEWRKTFLATEKGQLYLEPTQVFGSLAKEGAMYTKKGRGSIQKQVYATLQVLDERILVDRHMPKEDPQINAYDLPVYIDRRGTVNPSTRGRNIRYRVAANRGWKVEFTILWDKTIVSTEQMKAVCNDAGTLCGIGNARKIGFGRFEIESFEIIE